MQTVAKEQGDKEHKMTNKDSNLSANKDTRTVENMQNKNNAKNNSALKGISQDLLNKVTAILLIQPCVSVCMGVGKIWESEC